RMISKSIEEGPKQSPRKVVLVVDGSSERNSEIVRVTQEFFRNRQDLQLVAWDDSIGTMGRLSQVFHDEANFGLDFGVDCSQTGISLAKSSRAVPDLSACSDLIAMMTQCTRKPDLEQAYDFKRDKRKGKYSKYHKNN